MYSRSLQIAIMLTLLCTQSLLSQDASTLNSWNHTLDEVIRASRDPVGEFTSDLLARGEKAANGLLAIDMPADVSSEQWRTMQAAAYKVLGWAFVMDIHGGNAVADFERSLELDPSDVRVWKELGIVLGQEVMLEHEKSSRIPTVLCRMVRAAVYDGPGAVPAPQRKQSEPALADFYQRFFDDDLRGLERLKELAKDGEVPAKGFLLGWRPSGPRFRSTSNEDGLMGNWAGKITTDDGVVVATYIGVLKRTAW